MSNDTAEIKQILEGLAENIKALEKSRNIIAYAPDGIPPNLFYDAANAVEYKPESKPKRAVKVKAKTVEDAQKFESEMSRFIDTVLIPNIDYGVAESWNGYGNAKPSLRKSGAEKVMNFMGLVCRYEIIHRHEDYGAGFFSYETKAFLISSSDGSVCAEGVASANTRESQYQHMNGYSLQNVVLKASARRAMIASVLCCGCLSQRFICDLEDGSIGAGSRTKSDKPPTQRQMDYLHKLMEQSNTPEEAVNQLSVDIWGVDNYKKLNTSQISELISKFQTSGQQ